MSNLKKYIIQFSSFLMILLVWFVVGKLELVNPIFIPKLEDTYTSIFSYLKESTFYQSIGATIYRALFGLILSILIGVPLGLFLGRNKNVYTFFELPIEFFRAIPSSALFPLFILFFGIGDWSKIAVVVYACSLIILINTYYGLIPTQEKLARIRMMETLKASKSQILRTVVFRDALPNISSGIRICISLSFVLVVVTEMFLNANKGLGKLIYDTYLQYKIPEMYAVIILLGLTGFLFNKAYILLEKRYLFWKE